MTYHTWGDDWPYWEDLRTAISFCKRHWHRWGRIGTAFSKEKYGSFRHNCTFYRGCWPMHELINPGYAYYQWPSWLMFIETVILNRLVRYTGIVWLVRQWQGLVYNLVIWYAVRRWPHIRDELLCAAEYNMLWWDKTIETKYWE